ncbi:MAG: hypothetical protein ABR543_04110 [Gemmatimonadaceae bacterium]
MMQRGDPKGFTLIDVVIALAIGAALVLGARAMLVHVGDSSHRIADATRAADRDANAERLLRTVVGRLEVGTGESVTFSGREHEASFTTWCDVPAGWLERCEATLAVSTYGDSSELALSFPGQRIVLQRGFEAGALRYLNTAAHGGQWFRQWGTGITAPLAIGIILDSDTTIVRIGERG